MQVFVWATSIQHFTRGNAVDSLPRLDVDLQRPSVPEPRVLVRRRGDQCIELSHDCDGRHGRDAGECSMGLARGFAQGE